MTASNGLPIALPSRLRRLAAGDRWFPTRGVGIISLTIPPLEIPAMTPRAFSLCIFTSFTLSAFAADPPTDIRELKLKEWQPRSMLVTKVHVIEKPKFPVIDIHNHLGTGKNFLTPQRVER